MIGLKDDNPLIKFWSEGTTYHLDVREFLENGGEPYAFIMECVQQVSPGDTLVVHALFEPKPLLGVVRKMGLTAEASRADVEHWHVEITRGP
jgi:hypothetical protein